MNYALPKHSIVLFTWHSKKNIELLKPFVDYLMRTNKLQCHIITSDATGKLTLLNSNNNVYTINELLLAYEGKDLKSSLINPVNVDHPLDLHLDWLYTPKDPVLLQHPERKTTQDYYNWKRQQLVSAYHGFLRDLGPDSVVTWNGSLLVTGALADAADMLGVQSFYMERGLLPGSLVIDPDGVNNQSSIAGADWQKNATPKPDKREVEALKFYCLELGKSDASIVKTGEKKSSDAVISQLGLSPEKPVVLLPLQIESDSNIRNNSPYFKSMIELVRSVTSVLEDTGAQLIVKPHPEDRSRREEIEALCGDSDVRCCWELSLQSLLPVTDLVVVINSTVGLEALLQNKPVVALGRSIYDRKGFTMDLLNEADLCDLINRALNALWQPHEDPNFWWFLKTLIHHHTFFYDDQPGLADIKPKLSEMLVGSETEAKSTAKNASKAAAHLKTTNESLAELMRGEFTGKVLVIGPLDTVMDNIPDQIAVLNRSSRPRTFLKALIHRYDLMICMEWPSNPLLRAFLSLLRAKQKIVLG